MSETNDKHLPNLRDAAKAVLEAWDDYIDDDGQTMPAMLLDVEPSIMGAFREALEVESTVAEMAERVMGLVVPFLKDSAKLSSDPQIHIIIGACEQLQFEAKGAVAAPVATEGTS